MRPRWVGVLLVVIVAVGIVAYKQQRVRRPSDQLISELSSNKSEIVLIVDPREADSNGDNCAEIIHLVRGAGGRGIRVQELAPESDSPLLKQYRVLSVPTVLILDGDGNVVSRYEGEETSTVQEIRDRLANLSEVQR
jgi:hypothetical protein